MAFTGRLNPLEARQLNAVRGAMGRHKVGDRLRALAITSAKEAYLLVGTSTTASTLRTYADHAIEIHTTCASVDTSNSVEPIYMKSTMTGAAGVGGRARFHMYTNVALGGWSNALKAYAEYGATGSTAGLGSALCAETVLSAGTSSGTYTALEAELHFGTTGVTGTKTSFLYCNTAGTAKTVFDTSGVFLHIGDGITAAAGKFASATYQTLKCYFTDASTTRYLFLSQIEDGISLGNSSTAQTHTAGTPLFQIYSTCSSGAAEPFYMKSVMTGTGGTGGRARFHLYTNSAQGGWCNPLKAFMEFGAAGRITGLASAMCTDLELSAGTTQGGYTTFEANIIADVEVSTGTATSFVRCNVAGTNSNGKGTINSNAYFLEFGEGVTMGSSDDTAIVTSIHADGVATHQIRCRAPDGSNLWIMATTELASS